MKLFDFMALARSGQAEEAKKMLEKPVELRFGDLMGLCEAQIITLFWEDGEGDVYTGSEIETAVEQYGGQRVTRVIPFGCGLEIHLA
jgi:hypothetical protein